MKKATVNENAAQRKTYVGHIFDEGEYRRRCDVLNNLPEEWRALHDDGRIYIHDLDAYGLTYNCLTFNFLHKFPYERYSNVDDFQKITGVFELLKLIVSKVSNEQSGGMAFANFDNDLATVFMKLNIDLTNQNRQLIRACIRNLIVWCTESHERMGQVSYYLTLNIGLVDNDYGRYVCETLIDVFYTSPSSTVRPNIVFKVKSGFNKEKDDPYYHLLEKSLLCSAKRMIPTYLLCDSKMNACYDPYDLSIMGCRTRVVDDLFGDSTSIGRGNITNISINLPRLALEAIKGAEGTFEKNLKNFKEGWRDIADVVVKILIHRYDEVCKHYSTDYPAVSKYQLWVEDFEKNTESTNVFRHGTLSIGFIGLSEAFEVLSSQRYYQNDHVRRAAVDFVRYMRRYVDNCKDSRNLNFSLLATSGEQIAGRFEELDSKYYSTLMSDKGYYTNSFHVNVDSELTAFEKIAIEGQFHNFCNGGCITYVEIDGSPLGNSEALAELIDSGIKSGVNYLGFNFKLDICDICDNTGIFDICDMCKSDQVTHLRRVSGYLEDARYFTSGKKHEVKDRLRN